MDIDTGNQVIASFDNKEKIVLAIDARVDSDAARSGRRGMREYAVTFADDDAVHTEFIYAASDEKAVEIAEDNHGVGVEVEWTGHTNQASKLG